MSVLSDKLATLTTAFTNLEARVADAVPTPAELESVDTLTTRVDAILPTPVVPPTPEPTPAA